jgi:hypothetical protein
MGEKYRVFTHEIPSNHGVFFIFILLKFKNK